MKLIKANRSRTNLATNTVISNDTKISKNINKKRIAAVSIFVLVILICGLMAWNYYNKESEVATDPVQVEFLDEEQLNELANKDVDPSNVAEASRKAEALKQLDKPSEAVVVYETIEKSGNVSYEITIDKALAVLATGDSQKSIDLFNQALTELSKSSASDDVKKSKAKYINNKISQIRLYESTP